MASPPVVSADTKEIVPLPVGIRTGMDHRILERMTAGAVPHPFRSPKQIHRLVAVFQENRTSDNSSVTLGDKQLCMCTPVPQGQDVRHVLLAPRGEPVTYSGLLIHIIPSVKRLGITFPKAYLHLAGTPFQRPSRAFMIAFADFLIPFSEVDDHGSVRLDAFSLDYQTARIRLAAVRKVITDGKKVSIDTFGDLP